MPRQIGPFQLVQNLNVLKITLWNWHMMFVCPVWWDKKDFTIRDADSDKVSTLVANVCTSCRARTYFFSHKQRRSCPLHGHLTELVLCIMAIYGTKHFYPINQSLNISTDFTHHWSLMFNHSWINLKQLPFSSRTWFSALVPLASKTSIKDHGYKMPLSLTALKGGCFR